MRIGIMTHWWCTENYGQLLQCFALQSYLIKNGHEPFLIKYATPYLSTREPVGRRLFSKISNPASIVQTLRDRISPLTPGFRRKVRDRDFHTFRDARIRSTGEIYRSIRDLETMKEKPDAFICGSDQVWRFLPLDENGAPWFLGFGASDAKRVAYSASFGAPTVSDQYLAFAKPLLARFDRIGVREPSGIAICAAAGRDDAVHVADPTLLLPRESYLALANDGERSSKSGAPSAFLYFLRAGVGQPWKEIESYTNARGLEVDSVEVYGGRIPVGTMRNPSIPEWLRRLDSAEVVMTNSFHCTVFAIIMNRPFLSFLRTDSTASMNGRITSLLDVLGLRDRIYSPARGSIAQQIEAPIDWPRVQLQLSKLTQHSEQFLRGAGF